MLLDKVRDRDKVRVKVKVRVKDKVRVTDMDMKVTFRRMSTIPGTVIITGMVPVTTRIMNIRSGVDTKVDMDMTVMIPGAMVKATGTTMNIAAAGARVADKDMDMAMDITMAEAKSLPKNLPLMKAELISLTKMERLSNNQSIPRMISMPQPATSS